MGLERHGDGGGLAVICGDHIFHDGTCHGIPDFHGAPGDAEAELCRLGAVQKVADEIQIALGQDAVDVVNLRVGGGLCGEVGRQAVCGEDFLECLASDDAAFADAALAGLAIGGPNFRRQSANDLIGLREIHQRG